MNYSSVFVLSVLVAVARALLPSHDVEHTPRIWPCPIDGDILPCVCTADVENNYDLTMDCSKAKKDDELTNAFKADFSFTEVSHLIIDQTDCEDCALEVIGQDTFGSVSFDNIKITNTNINTVHEEAFGNSHGTLISLSLTNNEISTFNFEAIKSYEKLIKLYLNGNKFNGTPPIPNIESTTLHVLDLSNNPDLIFQSPSVVDNCPVLREAIFSSGSLDKVPMKPLNPPGMFTGLKDIQKIHFTSNSITELQSDTIVAVHKSLMDVDFSHNSITNVFAKFVHGFNTNGTLNMANNNISLIDESVWMEIMTDIGTPQGLDLTNNPIMCGCDIAWLVKSDAFLSVLADDTKCEDQVTLVKKLPREWFEANCKDTVRG